jgi:sterol desaturase/sphingolipid hydroxylase (fatty acid hydroxylase superfamily)
MAEEKMNRWTLSFVIVGLGIVYALGTFLIGTLLWGVATGFGPNLMTLESVGPYWVVTGLAVPALRLGFAVYDWASGRIKVTITRKEPPEPGSWK